MMLQDPSKKVMIVGNHRLLIIGKTVADNFNWLYYFQRAAKTYILALQTSQPLRILTDEIAAKVEKQLKNHPEEGNSHFDELKAILDDEGRNYKQWIFGKRVKSSCNSLMQ